MQLTWAEKHYYRGVAEGRITTLREVLTQQIEHRLGVLPKNSRRRLESIEDPKKLKDMIIRMVDAKSLEDLGLDD